MTAGLTPSMTAMAWVSASGMGPWWQSLQVEQGVLPVGDGWGFGDLQRVGAFGEGVCAPVGEAGVVGAAVDADTDAAVHGGDEGGGAGAAERVEDGGGAGGCVWCGT